MTKKIITILCLLLWPLNLILNNTPDNTFTYIIPALLLVISYFMNKNDYKYFPLPILAIGLIVPKLAILPLVFFVIEMFSSPTRKKLVSIVMAIIVLALSFGQFWGQTVFKRDYEGEQLILRNIKVYPNALYARLLQNKPKIYTTKLFGNFMVLTDPNNYFFGMHPRPVVPDNQNLFKYPFVTLVFFIAGLLALKKHPHYKFVTILLISSIISLSVLKNYDRHDFILYVPLSIIVIHGINTFMLSNKRVFNFVSTILIVTAIPEFLRSYVQKIL